MVSGFQLQEGQAKTHPGAAIKSTASLKPLDASVR
jgi:hypothetical protein